TTDSGQGNRDTLPQAIWDALTSSLTTVGSIGKWIVDKLDVVLSTRASATALTTAQTDLTTLTIRLSAARALLMDNLINLDQAVSTRAATGAAMTLTAGECQAVLATVPTG